MAQASSGLILIHAVSRTLSGQVAWTIGRTLGYQTRLDWIEQPLLQNSVRSEFMWQGGPSAGAELTSALAGWSDIFFEVTQLANEFDAGSRWQYTPELGIKHRTTDAAGNILIGEDEMRCALARAGSSAFDLQSEMKNLLAEPWDLALEPLRAVGDESRVIWLHHVS